MKTLFMPLIAALGLSWAGAGLSLASDSAGVMTVSDRANAFTEAGVSKAKDAFRDTTFHARTEFHVEVYPELPDAKRAEYEKIKKDDTPAKNRFFGDFANELAKKHNSKGIFLVVFRKEGHVHAIDDRQTDAKRTFDDRKLRTVQEKLVAGFAAASKQNDKNGPEAKKLRDEALLDTTNYIASELKDTTVPHSNDVKHDGGQKRVGSNIGGYICLGLVALLGIWLVIGIIRALTNRGGGGGGYGPGGGYGGGGGGGFGSSLLGGLFGGLAGMWMYNQFFGGSHVSDMSAGQGGDYGNSGGDYNDTGAGDYDGGGDGGGSNYDEGGGDYGGSSDTGGGGDWGGGDSGGGGDFGGGGGDFGGGGDW